MKRYVIVDMGHDRFQFIDREDDYSWSREAIEGEIKRLPETDIEYPEGWEH